MVAPLTVAVVSSAITVPDTLPAISMLNDGGVELPELSTADEPAFFASAIYWSPHGLAYAAAFPSEEPILPANDLPSLAGSDSAAAIDATVACPVVTA